jgi:hypothetical protein
MCIRCQLFEASSLILKRQTATQLRPLSRRFRKRGGRETKLGGTRRFFLVPRSKANEPENIFCKSRPYQGLAKMIFYGCPDLRKQPPEIGV